MKKKEKKNVNKKKRKKNKEKEKKKKMKRFGEIWKKKEFTSVASNKHNITSLINATNVNLRRPLLRLTYHRWKKA